MTGRIGGRRRIADAIQKYPLIGATSHGSVQVIQHGLMRGWPVGADEGELRQSLVARYRLAGQTHRPPPRLGRNPPVGGRRGVAGQQWVPAENLGAGAGSLLSAGATQRIGQIPAQDDDRYRQAFKGGPQPAAGGVGCNRRDARFISEILNSELGLYPINLAFMVISTAASACDTGHPFLAPSAWSRNVFSSIPGTSPSVSR